MTINLIRACTRITPSRLVAASPSVRTRLVQFADAAAQHNLFAEQVGFGFLSENVVSMTPAAGAADFLWRKGEFRFGLVRFGSPFTERDPGWVRRRLFSYRCGRGVGACGVPTAESVDALGGSICRSGC